MSAAAEPAQQVGPFAPAVCPRRARLRAALIDLALERGLERIDVEALCERAGVSPREFARDFADVGDCTTRVYLANIVEFDRHCLARLEAVSGWPRRLRAVGYAMARYLRDRPREALFDFVVILQASETVRAYRDDYMRRLIDLVDEGRAVAPDPDSIGPHTAEAVLGSVHQFIAKQALEEPDVFARAESFVPELMYIAVRPYLGHEAALSELEIPPPPEEAE